MDRISHLMGKVLKKRGLGSQATAAHVSYVVSQWIEQQHPQHFEGISVESIEDGVLCISALDPVAAQKLESDAHMLQEFVQNSTGVPVAEIRISEAKRVA